MDRILFHHTPIPTGKILTKYNSKLLPTTNYEISLKKSSHEYMKWPFGQCIEYDVSNNQTFNAMSQIECQRKCLIQQYINEGNECVPRFINDMLTEFDRIDNRTEVCSKYFDNKTILSKECLKKCPEECLQIEYWSTPKETQMGKYRTFFGGYGSDKIREVVERRIVWSLSEPMFAYIDEPVLTFTAYLVYCGGLMGLWFGQSLKDLLSLFIVKLSNRFQTHFY